MPFPAWFHYGIVRAAFVMVIFKRVSTLDDSIDINRLASLDFSHLRDGDVLRFCPDCIWQTLDVDEKCPVCRSKLHIMNVTEEWLVVPA